VEVKLYVLLTSVKNGYERYTKHVWPFILRKWVLGTHWVGPRPCRPVCSLVTKGAHFEDQVQVKYTVFQIFLTFNWTRWVI